MLQQDSTESVPMPSNSGRFDEISIDTSLQYLGDVLLEQTDGIPGCYGSMALNELLELFRRYGMRLLDERVREDVERHKTRFKELYAPPDHWRAVGLTGRQVWFICDSFQQDTPRPVKVDVKGMRIVAGGQYLASLATYAHDFANAHMPVRLYQIANTDRLVDDMIRISSLEAEDNDAMLLEHVRRRR
jgi:hypothetical protein